MGKIYILDNDFSQRRLVEKVCEEIIKESKVYYEIMVVESFKVFFDNLDRLSISACDIFFMEIMLNHYYTGIDFARKIQEKNPDVDIVFFTRDRDASIEIINQNIYPLAYLVKNEDIARTLYGDLRRLFDKILEKNVNMYKLEKRIRVKDGGNIYFFESFEVNYIETDREKRQTLNVHLINKQCIQIRQKMKQLQLELQYLNHMVVSKSMIINKKNIKVINRQEEFIQFRDGTSIYIGKKIIDKIRRANELAEAKIERKNNENKC